MMEMPPITDRIRMFAEGSDLEAIQEWGESCARMAREEERARCIQACRDERLEPDGVPEDSAAYDLGIQRCIAAIRKG